MQFHDVGTIFPPVQGREYRGLHPAHPGQLAELWPSNHAGFFHLAVCGNGEVVFTKRPVRTDAIPVNLAEMKFPLDGSQWQWWPGRERPTNPFACNPDGGAPAALFTYFVQPVGGGLVKIGRAVAPGLRFQQLQSMSPVPLRLLGTCDAAVFPESELHRRFSHLRSHGEWFQPSPELMAFIDREARA